MTKYSVLYINLNTVDFLANEYFVFHIVDLSKFNLDTVGNATAVGTDIVPPVQYMETVVEYTTYTPSILIGYWDCSFVYITSVICRKILRLVVMRTIYKHSPSPVFPEHNFNFHLYCFPAATGDALKKVINFTKNNQFEHG